MEWKEDAAQMLATIDVDVQREGRVAKDDLE